MLYGTTLRRDLHNSLSLARLDGTRISHVVIQVLLVMLVKSSEVLLYPKELQMQGYILHYILYAILTKDHHRDITNY